MRLSVLIPHLAHRERDKSLEKLLSILHRQDRDDIEILVETDEGELSIGRKSNTLIKNAKGDYVVFVGDDDEVADDYVARILKALEKDPDAVGIQIAQYTDGVYERTILCSHGSPFLDMPTHGMRPIWPTCPVRRSIALQVSFPDISVSEDRVWAAQILESGLVRRTVDVHDGAPLYRYLRSTTGSTTLTRKERNPRDYVGTCERVGNIIAVRGLPPIEDVVRAAGWDPATWEGTYVIEAHAPGSLLASVIGKIDELKRRLPAAKIRLSTRSEILVMFSEEDCKPLKGCAVIAFNTFAEAPVEVKHGGYRVKDDSISTYANRCHPHAWGAPLVGTEDELVRYAIGCVEQDLKGER